MVIHYMIGIIGDGALTGGNGLEALNNIASDQRDVQSSLLTTMGALRRLLVL